MKSSSPMPALGMTLIEVLVAMTIFAFGILGTLGMQARAISYFNDAKYRTEAALLTDSMINKVWLDRANLANYQYGGSGTAPAPVRAWLTEVQSTLPNGKAVVTVTPASSTVQVTVSWTPPNNAGGQAHSHSEIATVQNP